MVLQQLDNTMGGGHNKAFPLNFSGNLKNDWWKLFIPYLLAFGLMLLNTEGYYWDDWGAVGGFSLQEMAEQFIQNGNIWYGYFDWIFISAQPYGIALFRAFTFVSFFLCGMLVYEICRSLGLLSKQELFFITLLFLLLPFNTLSRNVLINSPYTFCYLLFFVGFYLVSLYVQKKQWFYRLSALAVLFVAFTMNSLLVFYALVLFYLLYMEKAYNTLKDFCKWIIRHIDFILLPIIFYVIKLSFFKPFGLYEGYNSVHLSGFLKAFIKTPIFSVLHLAHIGYLLFGVLVFLLIIAGLIMLYIRFKQKLIEKRDVLGVIIGFMVMFFGMFSYVAVYKYVQFSNLDDRHGILESLGAACIIVFSLNILLKCNISKILALSLLSLCAISVNIIAQTQLFSAYMKQVGVFETLMDNPTFLSHDTFLYQGFAGQGISDESFYQLNGLYKKLSNKSDKFIALDAQLEEEAVSYCGETPVYNCWEYKGDISHYGYISITPTLKEDGLLGFLSIGKMYLLHLFKPQTFIQKAKKRYKVLVYPPESNSDSPSLI